MRQLKRFLHFGGESAHYRTVFTKNLRAHAIGNGFNVLMRIQPFDKIEDGGYKLRPERVIAYVDGCFHVFKYCCGQR